MIGSGDNRHRDGSAIVRMRIDNHALGLFAGSMATCLNSGLPVEKCLQLSGGRTESKTLMALVNAARERGAAGATISEALEPGARLFPRHFLPLLRAGELAGRQVEAFQLVNRYCRQIGPSLAVLRKTWLYPLVCVIVGWVARAGILTYFGRYHAAEQFLEMTFGQSLLLVLAGWLLFKLPVVKRIIDAILLQLPLIRETEIRISVVLFFSTFRLVYEAGGLGVLRMFDLALATVRNDAVRQDLLRARQILAQNGAIGEAFAESAVLADEFKGLIHVGSISGQLDRNLTQLVQKATAQLEYTLNLFNQFFQRVVAFSVAMSIVETLAMCLL